MNLYPQAFYEVSHPRLMPGEFRVSFFGRYQQFSNFYWRRLLISSAVK